MDETVTYEHDGIEETVSTDIVTRASTPDKVTGKLEERTDICMQVDKVDEQQPILLPEGHRQTMHRDDASEATKTHVIKRIV